MKNILTFLFCFLFPACLIANEDNVSRYSFLHVTGEDGLSQSNVKAIWKDRYGFMWFGTKNGLNRYDGTSIVQLDCDDYTARKSNHNISALYGDKENRLWVGTDRGVYWYDLMSDSFTILDDKSEKGVGLDNWVSNIVGDSVGNVWIVIPDQGVFRYADKKIYFYEIIDKNNFKKETPDCIYVTQEGDVWVGTWGAGLFRYNAKKDEFEQYKEDCKRRSITELSINSICESDGWLFLAIQEGRIMKYHPQKNVLEDVDWVDLRHTIVRNIMSDNKYIWVGTHNGVYILNKEKHSVVHLESDLMDPFSLSDNLIYTMYKDDMGGIWLGTMFGGVNYLPQHGLIFEKYIPLNTEKSLSSRRIRGLAEDAMGRIWVGTEDGGLNLISEAGEVSRIKTNGMHFSSVLDLFVVEEKLYCGLYKQGMVVLDEKGYTVHYTARQLGIEEGSVYAFLIDSKGQKWIGTGTGLFVAEKNSWHFRKVEDVGYDWIFDIFEDREHNLWFASMGSGVWKWDAEKNKYEKFVKIENDSTSLNSNSVTSVMQDSKGRIWLSTDRGGLCRYNASSNNFTSFSVKEGLPDDVVYEVLEDDSCNLWFGTNRGLVKFNPETFEIDIFTMKDGLPGNQFNYKSALKACDGKFYLGGISGLVAFRPEMSGKESASYPIYISKFSIYNKEVTIHSADSPLDKNIIGTEEMVLPYDQSNISFKVSILDYSAVKSGQYFYRLDPLDGEWVKANCKQDISFANLAPGKYLLQVRGDNNSAIVRSLSIIILPPWWQTIYARILYVLCFVAVAFVCLLWYKRRKERQIIASQKMFVVKKEKELYEAKMTFFTEIAHEIRTPLTLINGSLEIINEMCFNDVKLNKNLFAIGRNVRRLLDLVSQLLDFQKIGTNRLKLHVEQVDVSALLSEICERFEPTILHQQKKLFYKPFETQILAWVDKESVIKIISNLLNNALKYATENIWVHLVLKETSFVVQVISDGKKIPKEKSEQIFEPFFRIDTNAQNASGIGIGLYMARSLASLNKGKLFLDLQETVHNKFVLEIPLNDVNVQSISPEANKSLPLENALLLSGENKEQSVPHPRYIILLVEDNPEVLDLLSTRLEEDFVVRISKNGQEALSMLKEEGLVDLIITDVMMPVMDGWNFCKAVKSDVELCHIPLVFLTAKNDLDSKILGLKLGAEAYVEKPFSFDYLKMQILSLLNNRQKEREAFSKSPFFSVQNMQVNKADKEFIDKAIRIVNENLTDENFNVEKMAEILCMSRSGLLRKIKILFNLSPVDFIRLIRLRRAAELIQTGKYRLGEICYMVGINSPSYFSKLFLKQWGMLPKDFEKQCHESKEQIDVDNLLK